jgi:hypothetical protein
MELNNTIHKSFIHSVFTIITVTHVGGTDLARCASRLVILELVLNCTNCVCGGADVLLEEEQEQEQEQEEKEEEGKEKRRGRKR